MENKLKELIDIFHKKVDNEKNWLIKKYYWRIYNSLCNHYFYFKI